MRSLGECANIKPSSSLSLSINRTSNGYFERSEASEANDRAIAREDLGNI
jgi:hypothetical protein